MEDLFSRVWELDREKSYARLTIIPIVSGEDKYYQCNEEIVIKPYPNPKNFGGMWGGNVAHSQEEVEAVIRDFNKWVALVKPWGLEKIEIIHKPEMTIAEYKNERRGESLEHNANSVQLSLV